MFSAPDELMSVWSFIDGKAERINFESQRTKIGKAIQIFNINTNA